MLRALRALSIATVLVLTFSSPAEAQLRRVPVFRTGIYSDSVGSANLVLHNVYGTSVPEIVSCSVGGAFALTKSGTAYRPVWYSGPVSCSAVAVGDVNGDGPPEVIVGTAPSGFSGGVAGSVLVFSPDRLGRHRASVTLPGTQQVTDVALGNVDGDAALEIVALSSTDAYVYNAATLALEWTATGRGGTNVAIADIEGNGLAEIIINGSQGHVLDASTQTLKWGYVGGFGSNMALGDVDNDGKPEIVGATGSTVTIIHGDTLTTSSFELSGWYTYAQALAVGDGNNDGVVEVVTGDDQWGRVHGWSLTGEELWWTNNPEHGVSGIAIGDPDGDGVNEAVWGAGWTSSGTDSVFVGNTSTHAVEWQAIDLDGSVYVNAADLDGDGDMEILVVHGTTDSGYDPGLLQVQNLRGEVEWSVSVGQSFSSNSRPIAGQFDSDPALEVLVLGGNRLYVFDGATHTLEWSSPNSGYTSVIAANIDADPVWEIIVGTSDLRVQILNGATNFVQGSSPSLGGYVYDLALADVNSDADLDLVVGTNNGFYVLKASDLSQRHYNSAVAAVRVAARPGEYAVGWGDTLITFSGATNAEQWRCGSAGGSTRLRYVTLYGVPWLASGNGTQVDFYPGGGTTCPTKTSLEHPTGNVADFDFLDVNGDGMPELLLSGSASAEIDLIAAVSAPRGDADGDGQVFDSDLNTLSTFLYGNGTLPRAGGDANGDFSVTAEDLFYLINYRRGTGAPPP